MPLIRLVYGTVHYVEWNNGGVWEQPFGVPMSIWKYNRS